MARSLRVLHALMGPANCGFGRPTARSTVRPKADARATGTAHARTAPAIEMRSRLLSVGALLDEMSVTVQWPPCVTPAKPLYGNAVFLPLSSEAASTRATITRLPLPNASDDRKGDSEKGHGSDSPRRKRPQLLSVRSPSRASWQQSAVFQSTTPSQHLTERRSVYGQPLLHPSLRLLFARGRHEPLHLHVDNQVP